MKTNWHGGMRDTGKGRFMRLLIDGWHHEQGVTLMALCGAYGELIPVYIRRRMDPIIKFK